VAEDEDGGGGGGAWDASVLWVGRAGGGQGRGLDRTRAREAKGGGRAPGYVSRDRAGPPYVRGTGRSADGPRNQPTPFCFGFQTESEYSVEEQTRLTSGGAGGGGDGDEASPEEEAGSLCEYHDIPPPPDGGYGWVVVFASFMCNMIVDGIAYTFGIFLGEFAAYFEESSSKVAWAGSLLSGVYLMAGPVVSALTNKYGCRLVCMAGSCIGTLAFVLSTFSGSVTMLMMTYGVLGGQCHVCRRGRPGP
jgi:hypothetical protein